MALLSFAQDTYLVIPRYDLGTLHPSLLSELTLLP